MTQPFSIPSRHFSKAATFQKFFVPQKLYLMQGIESELTLVYVSVPVAYTRHLTVADKLKDVMPHETWCVGVSTPDKQAT